MAIVDTTETATTPILMDLMSMGIKVPPGHLVEKVMTYGGKGHGRVKVTTSDAMTGIRQVTEYDERGKELTKKTTGPSPTYSSSDPMVYSTSTADSDFYKYLKSISVTTGAGTTTTGYLTTAPVGGPGILDYGYPPAAAELPKESGGITSDDPAIYKALVLGILSGDIEVTTTKTKDGDEVRAVKISMKQVKAGNQALEKLEFDPILHEYTFKAIKVNYEEED